MEYIANSPRLRLSATLLLTVAIGVLSSVLASQIMPQGVLDWGLLLHVSSFWVLVLVSIVWIFMNVFFMNHDENIMKFADDQHCVAYIRKAKLEGVAKLIRENPDQASLVDAKTFLRNLGVK